MNKKEKTNMARKKSVGRCRGDTYDVSWRVKYENCTRTTRHSANAEKENYANKFSKDKKKSSAPARVKRKVSQYDIEKCLVLQKILNRVDEKTIKGIAKAGEVVDFVADDVIVKQGDVGGCVYFVLYGSVSVIVNGKKVATRQAKECIGEMTMLDPTQKRSATLIAKEDSRLLKVKEEKLREYIDKEKAILEGIALELASRMREHTMKITKGNDIPNVFIGSSLEYSKIAQKIEKRLPNSDDIKPMSWQNGEVFELSKSNIESLCGIADRADFGIFILSKDDLTKSRGRRCASPRDNVLFEFGLFMGNLGRDRTFAICCGKNLKIPSDLNGVTFIMLDAKNKNKVDVACCVKKLRAEILKKGVR